MATTRIIPMHINKGKTISQCMKARIDYVKNPDTMPVHLIVLKKVIASLLAGVETPSIMNNLDYPLFVLKTFFVIIK